LEVQRCNRITETDCKIQTKEIPETLFKKKTKTHNPTLLNAIRVEAWAEVAAKVAGMVLEGGKAGVEADSVEAENNPPKIPGQSSSGSTPSRISRSTVSQETLPNPESVIRVP